MIVVSVTVRRQKRVTGREGERDNIGEVESKRLDEMETGVVC